jgi:predicted  nucleic acid-binding Zn-ribbon protein
LNIEAKNQEIELIVSKKNEAEIQLENSLKTIKSLEEDISDLQINISNLSQKYFDKIRFMNAHNLSRLQSISHDLEIAILEKEDLLRTIEKLNEEVGEKNALADENQGTKIIFQIC